MGLSASLNDCATPSIHMTVSATQLSLICLIVWPQPKYFTNGVGSSNPNEAHHVLDISAGPANFKASLQTESTNFMP